MFWENQNLSKALYAQCIKPVCEKYSLTRMEFDILMFLSNHPQYNTAADIVNIRSLTKSHVSLSLKQLEKRGLIEKYFENNNHKSLHLRITKVALSIIQAGQRAQQTYGKILFDGFSEEELEVCKLFFKRISDNTRRYIKEESTWNLS